MAEPFVLFDLADVSRGTADMELLVTDHRRFNSPSADLVGLYAHATALSIIHKWATVYSKSLKVY